MKKELYVSPKFKIQAIPKNGKKGVCVGYIDARDCQDILDNLYPNARQSDFYEVKGKVFCKVGVKIDGERLRRSDSGALESDEYVEAETTSKGETSDAFKRACVQWGIGRYLYTLPRLRIDEKEYTANKYNITEWVKKTYKKELTDWYYLTFPEDKKM